MFLGLDNTGWDFAPVPGLHSSDNQNYFDPGVETQWFAELSPNGVKFSILKIGTASNIVGHFFFVDRRRVVNVEYDGPYRGVYRQRIDVTMTSTVMAALAEPGEKISFCIEGLQIKELTSGGFQVGMVIADRFNGPKRFCRYLNMNSWQPISQITCNL